MAKGAGLTGRRPPLTGTPAVTGARLNMPISYLHFAFNATLTKVVM